LDVRIVAATNSDLKHSIENGTFREDLFFRLNVVPIVLPPLRERPEDIIVLAHHFLQTEAKALKLRRFSFSADALAALSTHEWPGNVRELQNRVRRALSMADSQNITAGQLGLESHDESSTDRGEKLLTLQQAREQAELHCIQKALAMTNNNISQAAKLLAISRPTLHDLLKKHKIKP
jgi:two-component system NtrC family response regulator